MVSFISLAFMAVKLQMFKCFCYDAAFMKPPFCCALSPLNMAQVC